MKKILITGANSYIGSSFEKYVKTNFPAEYSIDTMDMIDGTWEQKSFSAYDVVFHVAGIAHQKETKKNAKMYYAVNRDLCIETARKAKADGVKQFVFLSSMSVYGKEDGVITKNTPTKPKSHYGASKLQAEEAVLNLATEDFFVTVLRPPMVYGNSCRGNFNAVVKLVDLLPIFPKVQNYRSMIYIDNLSAFIEMVIRKELQGIFTPQNKEYMATCDMARWIAESRGKKLCMSRVLGLGVKILSLFISLPKKGFGNLVYHTELEQFDFSYCVVGPEQSVKNSVEGREEKACEG